MNLAVEKTETAVSDELNAFTFWVGDSFYAISLDNVLSIEQDFAEILPDPFDGRGAMGIIKHRDIPVRVFDFASFLGVHGGSEQKEELITNLNDREQEHIAWLDALEDSINNDTPFVKGRDAHHCEFGKWYDKFETRDEELSEIIRHFDEPHKRIHSLADELLSMKDRGEQVKALDILDHERATTLALMRRLFKRTRTQIQESIKSVLLFVTTDGKEPRMALRLNEISDMVEFNRSQLTSIDALGVGQGERLSSVFAGYLSSGEEGNGQDSLLIDVKGLLRETLGFCE